MTQHRARRRRPGRWRRIGRETVLTVGAVLGAICLVAAIVAMAFDVKPVVFRSGSMAPAIETGALALSRTVPASDLEVGDVVTVQDAEGVLVTHRIRSLTMTGDEATLILQGDANPIADPEPYVVQSVDRVIVDVPRLGYVVSALTGPAGIFAGGLLVGLVLTTVFARRRDDDEDGPDDAGSGEAGESLTSDAVDTTADTVSPRESGDTGPSAGRRRGRRKLVLAAAVVALAAGLLGTTSTTAAWVDDAQVRTGSFTMRDAPLLAPGAPSISACVRVGNSIQITFSRVLGASSYRVSYTSPSGQETVPAGLGLGPITYTTQVPNFNNTTGTIRVFAVNALGQSPSSNVYTYFGNGTAATCVPA